MPETHPRSPEDLAAASETARAFITEQAPALAGIFGIDQLSIQVGDGWATDMETGAVTVDPSFFIEQGYEPDWAIYGTLHEIRAHLVEVQYNPALTRSVMEFAKQGDAEQIFHNVMADISGNKAIHARLPRMADVAEDVYKKRLFPDDPTPMDDPLEQQPRYRDLPRHLQFLYKVIRQEMIPGSHTSVLPEVDEVIQAMRNYQGSGEDVITYSTDVSHGKRETPPEEKFGLWIQVIYPEYQKLVEIDKQDPRFQDSQKSQNGEPGEPQQGAGQDGKPKDNGQFGEYYQDYHENRHPEPLSKEDHDKLHDHAEHRKQKPQKTSAGSSNPKVLRSKQFKAETGHSIQEAQNYMAELEKWREPIDAMRELFASIIERRVAVRRHLGRQAHTEGALLDPNRLAQTVIDLSSGVKEPAAFLDYQQTRGETEMIGNTDYYLVVDASGSMAGEKAAAAAASTLIFLEGLGALQADIEEAEAVHDIDLGLTIRSCVYTFGDGAANHKSLSPQLDVKERIESFQTVLAAGSGGTSDFLALEAITEEPQNDTDRRRVIVVITDGESDNADRAGKAIGLLRSQPNTSVHGISIGSDDAVKLYAPNSKRNDDPATLPKAIEALLEETLR